jgi:non-heme chloroperoxidase
VRSLVVTLSLFCLISLANAQDPEHDPADPSKHTVQFITVDKDVKLEVLDWGGTGRPMVLLTGLGNNAHVFDRLAPKLITSYHVYGITRRGYGLSSAPVPSDDNYSADRLGDDVLAVIAALKLDRPIVVGHSIAGEELSSIGSRHPEKVAGLIYLDAAFAYAFYDPAQGNLLIDAADLKRRLENLVSSAGPREQEAALKELQQSILPQFEKDLKTQEDDLAKIPEPPAGSASASKPAQASPIVKAILMGQQKYTSIKVPVLAICAVPHDLGPLNENDPVARTAAEARDLVRTTALANAFQTGVPSAHVVRLAHASHYIFNSNEADVLREINAFTATLPL